MSSEKKGTFVNVDELMPKVSIEDAARYYGVPLPELKKLGSETRSRCFLECGRTKETGDRVLSIQADTALKTWHCHQYECGKGGNLVSLCDLLKPGQNAGGKPRGERFKGIAKDLQAMAEGRLPEASGAVPAAPRAPQIVAPPENVPLARSPIERARALVTLDAKFSVDVSAMPPKASAYLRRRPYLTPEVMRTHRLGYLPRDTGEDKSGGTMRGKIVYPYFSESGEILTWFGRDPDFEDKHQAWGKTDQAEREPEKFHFVKGYQRGLELWNQQSLRAPEQQEKLKQLGLLLVEGPNDAIRLGTLGVPAVALCSNQITREQAAKAARLARALAGGIVTVFLDCDEEGEKGMKQCVGYLAQLCPVRLAWTSRMHGGTFKGRQPESVTIQEWSEIESFLRKGIGDGLSV
jgi:5S rRNA maturation endonuclease (ribonuclease M5)